MNEHTPSFLDDAAVARLLPLRECIGVMERAFRALADGRAVQPLRQVLRLPDGSGALYCMPAFLGDDPQGALAVKLITLFPGNAARGRETHQGIIVLFDARDGSVLAMMDAASVTALRTAAVSALATRLLALPAASVLALLGSGVQASSHLAAMLEVRSIRQVRVWSRTPAHARAFAAAASRRHDIEVQAVDSPELAVRDAHVVCTVTGAAKPILYGRWVAPGTHINAVGASTAHTRELDTEAVSRARVFVDSRESALAEAGDLLIPMAEGAITAAHIHGDLGDLVTGRVSGRASDGEVTIFESLGLAVEDAAAARYIQEKLNAAD
jgi:ornithine cyclodeaminase